MRKITLELFGETFTWEAREFKPVECVNPAGYAEIYGLSTEYVRRLCRQGRIPGGL